MIKEEEELQKFIYERFNMKIIEAETEGIPHSLFGLWRFVLNGRFTYDKARETEHNFSWISHISYNREEVHLEVNIPTRIKK